MTQLFDSTIDVRDTAPSYKEGGSYIDPSTGALYVAFNDGWTPVPPLQTTQEVVTFTESGISVSGDYSQIKNGSVSTEAAPYDATAANYTQGYGLSGEDGWPVGIHWGDGGNKFYMVGYGSDNVNEYNASTAYDVSTLSYVQSFSVGTEDDYPRGLTFNGDGTKFYVTGSNSNSVHEYTLSTAWDVSTASLNQSTDLSGESSSVMGHTWGDGGSKFYIAGDSTGRIYEYDATTAYDVSTLSYVHSFGVGSEDGYPRSVAFSSDGTLFQVPGDGGDVVYQYECDPWDVSTASLVGSKDVGSEETGVHDVIWDGDGGDMYITGTQDEGVWQYDLQAPLPQQATVSWDSLPDPIESWDIATFEASPDGGTVTIDILDGSGNVLYSDVSPNFDISTVSDAENVQIRATLDGTTGTNYPTLDYVARRLHR